MRDALAALGALVLEDDRRWGEAASPHQWADARAVLDTVSPVARHWLGRSRGYSKTTDVAAMTVAAGLTQLPAGSVGYLAAADRDQARLALDAVRGFEARTPELAGAVEVQGYRLLFPSTGVVVEVLAADAASAYGLRGPWFIVDELCQWAGTPNALRFYEALSTAWPKVPGTRAVVMTTAGDPAHWSRRVYDSAVAEPGLWRVSEVHGPPPWVEARLLEHERRRLLPSAFQRLWLNEWAATEDALVDPDDLDAAMVLDGPLPRRDGVQYVVTLDVGLVNDATVVAVAHGEPHPAAVEGGGTTDVGDNVGARVVVDRLKVWQGSKAAPVPLEEVAAYIEEVSRGYGRAPVVFDLFQAAQLSQQLRTRGVDATPFTFSATSVGKLATTLHSLLRQRSILLPDDEALREELLSVRLRTNSAGVVRLDHASGRHDDRAVAIALAAQHLLDAFGGSTIDGWLDPTPQLEVEPEQLHPMIKAPPWWNPDIHGGTSVRGAPW